MNIKELKRWEKDLQKGKIKSEDISRQESLKLIIDAMKYLSNNGNNSDSRSRIESNLSMIEFYENMEKKFDTALKAVQNEIKELETKSI